MVDHAGSPVGERSSTRDVADLLRDLRTVRQLPDDDARRQAWLKRKRDLLGRITAG